MTQPISVVIIGGKLRGPAGLYPFAAWVEGTTYQKHSVLSHNNTVWLSLRVTEVEPSDAVPADWAEWIDGDALAGLTALKEALGLVDGAVTHMQMQRALVSQNKLDDVLLNAIGPEGTDTASIHWHSRYPIVQGNALSNAIKTALSYSDADMTTLFTLARTFVYNTP